MDIRRYRFVMGWMLAGSLIAIGSANAADPNAPGIARIRSQSPSAAVQQTGFEGAPVPDPAFKTATSSASTTTNISTTTLSGDFIDADCADGYHGSACGWCGGYGCSFCNHHPWWFGSRQIGPLRWLLCDGYCTVAPGHGWARPYKVPVRRIPVGYTRYYGGTPVGMAPPPGVPIPPAPPMIYTATDTTQLGYSYQRVPLWVDQPHLYPPTPWPANIHYRHCPNGRCHGAIGYGYAAPYATEVIPADAAPVIETPAGGPVEATTDGMSPAARSAQIPTATY